MTDLNDSDVWAYCLSLFALPRHVHVVDQEGQPYGSVRRCCNRCGAMAAGRFYYVASIAEWNEIPAANRCGICRHTNTRPGKNAPRRWGSDATEVCQNCGAFRTHGHDPGRSHPSAWFAAWEYAEATAEIELD